MAAILLVSYFVRISYDLECFFFDKMPTTSILDLHCTVGIQILYIWLTEPFSEQAEEIAGNYLVDFIRHLKNGQIAHYAQLELLFR